MICLPTQQTPGRSRVMASDGRRALAQRLDSGRALTIRSPWIGAQLLHGRDIEVRSWPPPAELVGRRVWLHCAKGRTRHDRADEQLLAAEGLDVSAAAAWRGHIVGRARLKGVVELQRRGCHYRLNPLVAQGVRNTWLNTLLPARYRPDVAYVWLLGRMERAEPVPAIGRLRLWRIGEAEERAALAAIIAHREAVVRDLTDGLAWEMGEPRRRGTSIEMGRRGVAFLRVDASRMLVETEVGGRMTRHADLPSLAAIERTIRSAGLPGCSELSGRLG